MPSLAQGYGRGLLLGLQLEETKRQKQRDELSDEFLRERLEDMRFQRKTLMSQLKREEEERREAGLEEVAKGHRMAETGVGLRDLLLGAGITMPQAELAETEYYETEKIPKYAAEWITPKVPKKPTGWEKAPARKETKIKKWVTAWNNYYKLQQKEPPKTEEFETPEKFRIAMKRHLETTQNPKTLFNKWSKQIPAHLRMAVKQRVGLYEPVGPLAPEETIPDISLLGQPPSEEETFHGAESYEDVVEAVANIPEPKRSEILEEAKAFFGIE